MTVRKAPRRMAVREHPYASWMPLASVLQVTRCAAILRIFRTMVKCQPSQVLDINLAGQVDWRRGAAATA